MEPPSSHTISILNRSGRNLPTVDIERALDAALKSEHAKLSEVSLLLTDDEEIQDLNARFRGVEEPTDVLTFPDGEAASGDIAISVPFAERQARERGIPIDEELVYLAVHGALHLAGLDDQTDTERDEMLSRMNRIVASLGHEPDRWQGSLHPIEGGRK